MKRLSNIVAVLALCAATARAEGFAPVIDVKEMRAAIALEAALGHVDMHEITNSSAYLPNCKAQATLVRVNGQLKFRVSDSHLCSNVSNAGNTFKLAGENGSREASFNVTERAGANKVDVTLHSNSRKTSDTVTIRSYKVVGGYSAYLSTFWGGKRVATLANCGGTVELTKSFNQVNLVFRGVENCSNFDILGSNGEKVDYTNKKLGGGDRNRSGSFTIPDGLKDGGSNAFLCVVKSNSGKTSDRILVEFFNW